MIHIDPRSSFARIIGKNYLRVVIPRISYRPQMKCEDMRQGWATVISRRTGNGIDCFAWHTFRGHKKELRLLKRQVRDSCIIYLYTLRTEDNGPQTD